MNPLRGSFWGKLVRRPSMKHIVGLLFLVLLTVRPGLALADESICLDGDALVGPNCVHAEGRPGRDPMTTVYRVEGKKVSTVWDGVGTVVESTAQFILVEEPTDNGRAKVRHNWTGSAYAR